MGTVNRCHGCTGRFERSGFTECPQCEKTFHEKCLEYHSRFDCPRCAEDLAVGAVEF